MCLFSWQSFCPGCWRNFFCEGSINLSDDEKSSMVHCRSCMEISSWKHFRWRRSCQNDDFCLTSTFLRFEKEGEDVWTIEHGSLPRMFSPKKFNSVMKIRLFGHFVSNLSAFRRRSLSRDIYNDFKSRFVWTVSRRDAFSVKSHEEKLCLLLIQSDSSPFANEWSI